MRTRIVRAAVLTGAAAVAALAAAGPATAATTDAPVQVRVVADAPPPADPGAPVTTPDGHTVTVTGFPTSPYRATDRHRTAVVQLAADSTSGGDLGGNPGAPGPQAPQVQQPVPQQPAPAAPGYDPNQVNTQASGGTIAVTTAVTGGLLIAVILIFKKRLVRPGWGLVLIAFGVLTSATIVGDLVRNLAASAGSTLTSIVGGL